MSRVVESNTEVAFLYATFRVAVGAAVAAPILALLDFLHRPATPKLYSVSQHQSSNQSSHSKSTVSNRQLETAQLTAGSAFGLLCLALSRRLETCLHPKMDLLALLGRHLSPRDLSSAAPCIRADAHVGRPSRCISTAAIARYRNLQPQHESTLPCTTTNLGAWRRCKACR